MTLYDVIGARVNDDAETLKNAFRNAVKASHPDLHAEDPQSAERFKEIVRANAILSDPEQRALYDNLLAFERWQEHGNTRGGLVRNTLRNLAGDAITVMLLAVLLAGGYAMYMHVTGSSVSAVEVETWVARGAEPPWRQTEQQGGQVEQGIRLSREELHELLTGSRSSTPSAVAEPTEGNASALPVRSSPLDVHPRSARDDTVAAGTAPAHAAKDPIAQGVSELVATEETSASETREAADHPAGRSDDLNAGDTKIGEARSSEAQSADARSGKVGTDEAQANELEAGEAPSSDPKFYYERGVASYRKGDLDLALTDFNKAILLDPNFTDAYVNRGIVFYRKAEVDRAFADIARATHIQDSLKLTTRSRRAAGAGPRN
jgi:curved DNA-binding protein CbpA